MPTYDIDIKVITHTGNIDKPVSMHFTVEATSREEARVRCRAAAARLVSKPDIINVGEIETFHVDGEYSGSSEVVFSTGIYHESFTNK